MFDKRVIGVPVGIPLGAPAGPVYTTVYTTLDNDMNSELDYLLDNIPTPGFAINAKGRIVSANIKMATLFGVDYDLCNLSINSMFDTLSFQYLNKVLNEDLPGESDQPYTARLLAFDNDKNEVYIELNWKKFTIKNENYWLFIAWNVDGLRQEIETLKLQATRDELTGINNRRNFINTFDEEIKKARRYEHAISLLLMDIDHFKNINDTYGHPVGDSLLTMFSRKVQPLLRECDFFARLGGDEFAVLMPETNLMQAQQVADRIKKTIGSTIFSEKGKKIKISTSIGVAAMSGGEIKKNTLLELSDAALYKAKYSGRNKVVVEKSGAV